ncbi:FMN-binding negative transcriptional regulator [Ornithinibacillus halotolerans]|uniref:Protease synthase and sporulation protein PAI 2 n=1 Tax=Ornithinibacillus halotolerans TaxID=1274357 RepID=A0A916RZV5_9BACI|nr:FMN-binding negative transcriptional regulator [Ornithinibacillus halotolerans]GGA78529.1 protease synthase and sporulation protein PAI 2 [Ornithinibacillus halotolerans]
MYIPKHFKVTDVDEVIEFIEMNSFGTIVTTEQGKPIATHLPLELHKQGDDYYITGHFAYANPQWKTLNENVLVIYQGPHAYVSSTWYSHENVPTWNYQSVHIYGKASLMNEQELEEDLKLLLKKYENHRENAALWENLSSQSKRQIKGIVGFKIKVEEIQAAYKLSQNRNKTDYNSIIEKLKQEHNPSSQQVAELMKKRRVFDKG